MCQVLIINKQEDTPEILFDKTQGIFKISGRSLPEDVTKFFGPVHRWILDYLENPNPKTVFTLQLEYLNTSSSRKMVEILIDLEKAWKKGTDIEVVWQYASDDELMEIKGSELTNIVDLPIRLEAIS